MRGIEGERARWREGGRERGSEGVRERWTEREGGRGRDGARDGIWRGHLGSKFGLGPDL